MNVVVCDDHRLFAEALATVLRHEGATSVEVVTSPDEAVHAVAGGSADVCVMDVWFPEGGVGIDAARRLRATSPSTRVLMLTSRTDHETAAAALDAGAAGVVYKVQPISQIVRSVFRLADGEVVVDSQFVRSTVANAAPESRRDAELASYLTAREREVLTLLVAGQRTEAIASRLGIGVTTTRGHVQSILTKLQVHSRIKAVAFAVRNGIVDLDDLPDSSLFDRVTPPRT